MSNGRVFFAVFGGLVCYVLLGLSGGLWQERGPLSGPNPQRESSALNRRPLLGVYRAVSMFFQHGVPVPSACR